MTATLPIWVFFLGQEGPPFSAGEVFLSSFFADIDPTLLLLFVAEGEFRVEDLPSLSTQRFFFHLPIF